MRRCGSSSTTPIGSHYLSCKGRPSLLAQLLLLHFGQKDIARARCTTMALFPTQSPVSEQVFIPVQGGSSDPAGSSEQMPPSLTRYKSYSLSYKRNHNNTHQRSFRLPHSRLRRAVLSVAACHMACNLSASQDRPPSRSTPYPRTWRSEACFLRRWTPPRNHMPAPRKAYRQFLLRLLHRKRLYPRQPLCTSPPRRKAGP